MKPSIFFSILPLSFLCGCLFVSEPFKPIRNYDFGKAPSPSSKEIHARLASVRMAGPYKFNMVFRENPNELSASGYDKWVQTPEVLLKSYLTTYLGASPRPDDQNTTVEVEILVFEADCLSEPREAVMTVRTSLTPPGSAAGQAFVSLKTYRTAMKDRSPSAFAEAMGSSVAKFAEELVSEIESVNKK